MPVPRAGQGRCLEACPAGQRTGRTEQGVIIKYYIEAKHHPKAIRWSLHDPFRVWDQLQIRNDLTTTLRVVCYRNFFPEGQWSCLVPRLASSGKRHASLLGILLL